MRTKCLPEGRWFSFSTRIAYTCSESDSSTRLYRIALYPCIVSVQQTFPNCGAPHAAKGHVIWYEEENHSGSWTNKENIRIFIYRTIFVYNIDLITFYLEFRVILWKSLFHINIRDIPGAEITRWTALFLIISSTWPPPQDRPGLSLIFFLCKNVFVSYNNYKSQYLSS